MALTTADVLGRIDAIHKERSNYGHPLWSGMVDGTHNLEQVRYFCKQHSILPNVEDSDGTEFVHTAMMHA